MSCIVQLSQIYLPAFGLLRQVDKRVDRTLDLQQSDGKAIPGPPPSGLKLDPGLASRYQNDVFRHLLSSGVWT